MLLELNLSRSEESEGSVQFYVSDIPLKFDEIGTRFLGQPVVNAQRIDFDSFLIENGAKIHQSLNL